MNLLHLQETLREIGRLKHIQLFGREPRQRAILEPLMKSLGVEGIKVDELSTALGVKNGRVLAVRWDITTGQVGFKQPVMAALLLFHLWRKRCSVDDVTTIVDGGNVNTSLALGYLAQRLGLRAEHVLSRHFPEDIRAYMMDQCDGCLQLIEAPPSGLGREREFYAYLFELMQGPRRRRSHLCLWHAKYSALTTLWMGEAFADTWDLMPDDIVLGLGSGSTLGGYAVPLKVRFNFRPRIVVAEHAQSALLRNRPLVADLSSRGTCENGARHYRRAPASVPHMVLGPHYDEVNPLLPSGTVGQIDGVVRYSDNTWQEASQQCIAAGIRVGNSSAANLAVAKSLAQTGRTVFTFIYEPLRDFYLSTGNSGYALVDSRQESGCENKPRCSGNRVQGEGGGRTATSGGSNGTGRSVSHACVLS